MDKAASRLQSIASNLSSTMSSSGQASAHALPFNPDATVFPNRASLPVQIGAPKDAAWVWGEDDQLGRINLLTPARVKDAVKEVRTGEIVSVNLPLQHPVVPAWGRQAFTQRVVELDPGKAHDDVYELNTQSGTQWDGFRHVAHMSTRTFYNGAKADEFLGQGEEKKHKCSIHHLAAHGIAGRGVLLDVWGYAKKKGIVYDPWTHHSIPWELLNKVGEDQGIDIRPASQGGDIKPGDMLFIRSGWAQKYWGSSHEDRVQIGSRPARDTVWAGVAQEEKMIDWLHDCWFATVGGDAPAFEAWPTKEKYALHEYLLALWGVPIGEMLDLEKLAQRCEEQKRWTFFFTSMPNHCEGGVGSHVNGQAIF